MPFSNLFKYKEAEVIFLIGQTLNWMYHFGESKFSQCVKFIQLQSYPEDLHLNRTADVALTGDINSVIEQMNDALKENPFSISTDGEWWNLLNRKKKSNEESLKASFHSSNS